MENSIQKARTIYRDELVDYLKRNKIEVSDHISHVMLDMLLYRDSLNPYAGSFAKSVVLDRLSDAVRYADVECLDHLPEFVVVCLNFSIPYNQQKEIEYSKNK